MVNGLLQALAIENPLQHVGTIHVYSAARLAKRAGFRAIYLSGTRVVNAFCGPPDPGMTNLGDVVTDVQRLTATCDLPLTMDRDTGWQEIAGCQTERRSVGCHAAYAALRAITRHSQLSSV